MTQEERFLLFQDLCARLPYGVKVQYKGNVYDLKEMHKDGRTYLGSYNSIYGDWHCSLEFEYYPKPYLRPMSSMTEEEEKEYRNIDNRSYSCPMDYAHIPASDRIDWLNKKMFDYRGLIKKNLALEAPEGIYKIEQSWK